MLSLENRISETDVKDALERLVPSAMRELIASDEVSTQNAALLANVLAYEVINAQERRQYARLLADRIMEVDITPLSSVRVAVDREGKSFTAELAYELSDIVELPTFAAWRESA